MMSLLRRGPFCEGHSVQDTMTKWDFDYDYDYEHDHESGPLAAPSSCHPFYWWLLIRPALCAKCGLFNAADHVGQVQDLIDEMFEGVGLLVL